MVSIVQELIALLIIDREAGEIIRLVASVCLCVCTYVEPLLCEPFDLEPFDLRPSFLVWELTLT